MFDSINKTSFIPFSRVFDIDKISQFFTINSSLGFLSTLNQSTSSTPPSHPFRKTHLTYQMVSLTFLGLRLSETSLGFFRSYRPRDE